MYRYTYASRVTLVITFLLCISLFIQPVASAYAEESTGGSVVPEQLIETPVEDTGVVTTENSEQDSFPTPEEIEDAEQQIAELIEESLNTASNTDDEPDQSFEESPLVENPDNMDESIVVDSQDPVATSTADATEDSDETPVTSDDLETDGDANESTNPEPEQSDIDEEEIMASSTEEVEQIDEEHEENEIVATTTDEVGPTVQEVSVVNSDQAIAFNRNECTEVSDGSFYCQKVSEEDVLQDALFAAPDNTGDMEIYVVQDGVETKLTDNVLEDSSPYFDSRSDTIVWHRLINDRYQIISYDIDAQEETQLTDTRVNNMEPTKSGKYTVWQRWVTNNWEIVLFDGETETQLTDSQKHDIAPNIYGDMIIWNVRSNDGTQSLMTYEISTQTFNQIADTEGVAVANPRMLVTYEAQYQNGDSVLKGFDLATGEIVPIEHLPRELPTNLPEPDATGEIRALPTGTTDEEEQEQQEPEPNDDPVSPTASSTSVVTVSTTTVEVSPDLDLRPVGQPLATTTDLVVEQAAIPDVVIPAFEATTTESTASSTQDS